MQGFRNFFRGSPANKRVDASTVAWTPKDTKPAANDPTAIGDEVEFHPFDDIVKIQMLPPAERQKYFASLDTPALIDILYRSHRAGRPINPFAAQK